MSAYIDTDRPRGGQYPTLKKYNSLKMKLQLELRENDGLDFDFYWEQCCRT